MVGRRVLAPVMGVRALLPQPLTVDWAAPSSRGPGHGPLKAETRVRIPLGPPLFPIPSFGTIEVFLEHGTRAHPHSLRPRALTHNATSARKIVFRDGAEDDAAPTARA